MKKPHVIFYQKSNVATPEEELRINQLRALPVTLSIENLMFVDVHGALPFADVLEGSVPEQFLVGNYSTISEQLAEYNAMLQSFSANLGGVPPEPPTNTELPPLDPPSNNSKTGGADLPPEPPKPNFTGKE